MRFFSTLLLIFIVILITGCSLQYKYRNYKNTFENEIQELEQLNDYSDKSNYLLFIGSSSIKRWNSIERDMAPYSVLKRGYGGAHYYDLIHFIERLLIDKNKAKAVFIFVANDITKINSWDKMHKNLSPKEIKKLFTIITRKIHKNLSPEIPIYVIETTPTPSRWEVWSQIANANDLIKAYTEKKSNLNFISTRNYFLNKNGLPRGEYFVEDSLHLNNSGYELWEKIIKKVIE